ncbi:L-2-amino-thiazoline-4-carboxylic acid hydrolase [hydrothermal vent metagenome]|uniref:L-2-amino-thiazoline-4-carboxylic acid hydrolase n=1 Tax=hydrothermal vent metagenome TaxID=652676 RepID=A0A3B0UHZ5_9ZZZZ
MSSPLPMLEIRRIEAAILKEIYDVIKERHGVDEAKAVLTEAVISSAIAQGESIRGEGDELPDLEDFADLIPLWEAGGALEVEMLHRSPTQLEFNIRRCKFSEMYAEMGLEEIGHLLSCNRDGALCTGYNPDIKLARSQTIMQGASYCDFRFTKS